MREEGKGGEKMELKREREKHRERIYAMCKEPGACTQKAETTSKSDPVTLGIYQIQNNNINIQSK